MKVLTIEEYNEQVKAVYPQDWAQCHKDRGYIAITDDLKNGMWGLTKQSAINKFNRVFKGLYE